MKCPHCLVTVFADPSRTHLGQFKEGQWFLQITPCPSCNRPTIALGFGSAYVGGPRIVSDEQLFQVYPRGSGRPPVPPEVTDQEVAEDYREACEVFPISTKASAALSRRCLQHLLRLKAGIKSGDLNGEIQQVLDSKALPTHLADAIDAIRHIGNFAAHPIKSKNTGQVLPVEPGEAEWNLDTLEGLFDFYYIQPALLAGKRAALNQKLQSAGKPPVK